MGEHVGPELPDDEELLAELGRHARRVDPEPAGYLDFAKVGFELRDLGAELGQRIEPSSVLSGVRSDADTRTIHVQFDQHRLVVELVDMRVRGQLLPGVGTTIVMTTRTGEQRTDADGLGRFSFDPAPDGPFRLSCEIAERRLITEWLLL